MVQLVLTLDVSKFTSVTPNLNVGAILEVFLQFLLFGGESTTEGAMIVSVLAFSSKMSSHYLPVTCKIAIRTLELQLVHSSSL